MRNTIFLSLLFFAAVTVLAQEAGTLLQKTEPPKTSGKKLPPVKVADIKGNVVGVSALSNDGSPFVLLFWATWCAP